eukprot:m.104225 g.104225  ORF g.104225 m.104225 type:complete len:53 (+) comp15747_c0_seq1:1780-1938(+)
MGCVGETNKNGVEKETKVGNRVCSKRVQAGGLDGGGGGEEWKVEEDGRGGLG